MKKLNYLLLFLLLPHYGLGNIYTFVRNEIGYGAAEYLLASQLEQRDIKKWCGFSNEELSKIAIWALGRSTHDLVIDEVDWKECLGDVIKVAIATKGSTVLNSKLKPVLDYLPPSVRENKLLQCVGSIAERVVIMKCLHYVWPSSPGESNTPDRMYVECIRGIPVLKNGQQVIVDDGNNGLEHCLRSQGSVDDKPVYIIE